MVATHTNRPNTAVKKFIEQQLSLLKKAQDTNTHES
jgi:hypothetical protein